MKNIFTFLVILFISIRAFAQAPQKMSYQAVIRNSNNALVSETVVGMRISILQGSAAGTPVYVETQTPTTNLNGLVSLEIGGGTIVTGTMDGINWATGAYFIKTETDPTGGTNYTISGTSQLMSVPYALYAASSGYSASSGNQATTGANVGDMQYWSGTTWVNIPIGQPGQIFRINASNVPEWYGSTFPTLTTNPIVTGATNLTTATCGGTIINDGGIINDGVNNQQSTIIKGVCWSTSPHPTILNNTTFSSSSENVFTATMTGLESETTYYVRAFVTNNTATGYGNELVYTVPKIPVPILVTTPVVPFSNIDITMAKSGGTIEWDNTAPIIEKGVCWSTSPNPTIQDFKSITYDDVNPFSSILNNIKAGTTYYVRAYATNNASFTGYGNEVVYLKNLQVPTITTTPVTNLIGGTASSGGHILYEGGTPILQRGICWSTSPNPTTADNKTSQGAGDVIFTSTAGVLMINTTYYVRAYATNSFGTGYGEQLSFITPSTISVGVFYQGGIVAYILQQGDSGYVSGETHGLIITSTDYGPAVWGCQGIEVSQTNGAIGTGNKNTIDAIAKCSNTGSALNICADLVLDGYNDWYLPSYNEIVQILANNRKGLIGGGFNSQFYWCSTLRYNNGPYVEDRAGGWQSRYITDLMAFRPVRSF